jgi:hypothetical protein
MKRQSPGAARRDEHAKGIGSKRNRALDKDGRIGHRRFGEHRTPGRWRHGEAGAGRVGRCEHPRGGRRAPVLYRDGEPGAVRIGRIVQTTRRGRRTKIDHRLRRGKINRGGHGCWPWRFVRPRVNRNGEKRNDRRK